MKKKWMSRTLALALAGTTVASMVPTVPVNAKESAATGTTYYVDSKDGKDSNAGTAENKAFQTLKKVNELNLEPGDTVLLKKGSVFEDQALKFTKEDSGTAEAPVKISTYGEGEKPKINTNGHGQWELNYGNPLDNQNHKWKGTVSSSILIEDTEYLEIEGLELTNDRKSATDTEQGKAYNDAYAMDRTGVAGVAKDNGTVDHIVLNDLYIHDVTGNVYNKHMTNGGIYFIVAKPTNEGETGIARYNDVQIRNCSLNKVNRWGIAVGYTYQWGQFETGELPDATMAKYGSSNVVIENNYLNHVGGDAITTMYLDRPLIQYNVSENAAEQINTTDYAQQQPRLDANGKEIGKQDVGAGRVAAGIWPWKCKNAIFQYNECFKTLNAASGNGDGQPWDADYGDGTNYQYNYSHGNTASTIMFCGGNSVNNTFRYNISQNEDMGPLDPAGNSGNCQVYNNTFYIKEGLNTIWHRSHGNGGPVDMENNIFYFAGNTPVNVKEWNPSGNKTYSNNLYYNVKNYPNDAAPVKVNAGTKVLENAGSGPDSVATDKAARKHEDPTKETVFDGYKLAEKSPAINKGKVVVDRNGYTIDHDFFGHAITAVPEIGAAESDVVADTLILRSNVYKVDGTNVSELPKNTTVDAFLKNIIVDTGVKVTVKDGEKVLEGTDVVKGGATIVLSYEGKTDVTYTVVASSDKELKASYYEVRGTEVQVPYTEKNPTTVKELKANLTVADTATVSVVNAEKELADKDAVADGMTLRITAEDGTTNDYAIKQKNEYNWTKDFINGQQGNVWFGQMKDGSGDWANMTSVDKDGWPNWATHTYYGPGIDDDQHVTTASSPDKHGLLSAPPSTNISTAMAYRVPKSGTVSFKVRDGEPYLRQSPNEGGTVTLSLYVNGTEKKNLTLETSKKKEGNWEKAEEIEVTRGDIIRVVAKCNGNPSKPSAHITPIITYVDKAAADKEAPTVPADVKASEIAHTGAKLTWTASKDNVEVAGYNVYLNDEKVNEELITGTEYDLADLTANTEYNVTVTAVDAAGNESEKSEAATFTTLKGADLTELTATIAEAEKILKAEDKDKYSEAALVELQELVEAGRQLTATSTQEAVDKMKDEITAKLADIQTQFTITATAGEGGKIELKDEIKERAKDETSYETKAYKGTSKVFTITPDKGYHIESITVDETDVKDIVKEYTFKDITEDHTIAVTFAKDGLTVAKENLLATINTAKEKLAEKDAYTPESVKELEEAVEAAQKVYDKEDSTKEEVDAAEKAVQEAQKALVKKETPKPEAPVKKDELKAAVEDATKVVGDTEQYTEESLAALQAAIDEANAVLDNPEATQAEIDAAVKAVKEAKEALKVKEDKKDDSNKGDDKKDDNKKDDGNSGASNNGSSNGGSNNNGSSNTGSTNTGSGNKGTTSTGSTTSHAAKTGDTTNVVTWLFALAASAAAGLGVVKRKKED
ncbi:fibronectin type III domain-containing protein [Mediterraneibacter faecis]|uniref:fibronectin type III domain-containing protein n=2 Tax=Mediterraneibacter faecis TaxID=592978 RepID=UPI001D07B56D|nr:fibronectin type III domain-containing protein [Mediterraneibacter faecis]MCB5892102.1 FIVAR domain-containing protein [Lachnospiraceae bacterium 210521-DFI.4.71]MCB7115628.1 FIVAR domain-containing protein [Mediterraneibacter faecis]MCB7118853.1 FIVAR domain-containing protein [Mediterraneibacter faecis]MCB7291193.1 FIVAR domain-containing protein [Mediterraneibacter faecis]MCB7426500.1 FIVAR domain-containing protein [Mediterraneibacter faecis]